MNQSVMGSVFSRYKTPALVNLDFKVTFTPHLLRKDLDLGLDARTIRTALDPVGFVQARRGLGGPAFGEVKRMISSRRRTDARWQQEVAARFKAIEAAERKLAARASALAGKRMR